MKYVIAFGLATLWALVGIPAIAPDATIGESIALGAVGGIVLGLLVGPLDR